MASAMGVARMPTQGSWRPRVCTMTGSLARLTDWRSTRMLDVGLIASDTVTGWPVEMPPAAAVVAQEAVGRDLVAMLGAALGDAVEAGADGHALDRVQAHHDVGDVGIEPVARSARPSRRAGSRPRPRCARRPNRRRGAAGPYRLPVRGRCRRWARRTDWALRPRRRKEWESGRAGSCSRARARRGIRPGISWRWRRPPPWAPSAAPTNARRRAVAHAELAPVGVVGVAGRKVSAILGNPCCARRCCG